MIDISVSEVATEVLVGVIGTAGRWLATAARAPRGRKAEDLSIARWFETYKLTDPAPELPELSPADAELLSDVLRGPGIQAALQELLAARLTDASNQEAEQAREVFCRTLTLALPSAPARQLADFYDDQIGMLVGRLEAAEPAMFPQIRSEALSARMIAVLHAIERHTAALNSAPRDAGTFLASYRRQVAEHHGKLKPPDFDRRRLVPIGDIYVPGIIYEELTVERFAASPPPPPLTVWELAARLDRTVLLGDPGGGKTTASNVLMHYFTSDVARRVPFLVTLRDFAASVPPARSVVGYIEHELETFYQCPAPPGLVDMLLLTGRAIVFFDGLDELLDTSRREDIAARVERFCTEYPLAPVLVTSRVVGYDQARLDDRQFACYRLGGFSDEDVATYARKWFALETDARPDEAETFLSESETVPDLRSNPLLLSLMCILYRGEGSLPRNRAEIYEQCATLLFRKWDARRHIHQELRAGQLVEPTLRHLAWWLFTREDTHSAVTERELVNATTGFLHGRGFESLDDARDAAREFIEFCRGRMWVFSDTGTTATGEKLYSFTHRTFLEYFAAAQLAFDSDTPEKLARTIAPHIAKGEWEVVGELAVQIKDSTSTGGARRVYETFLNERRRRAPEGRSNILQFLSRALRSVDPPPTVIRRLVREVLQFLFSGDPDLSEHGLPLAWLLANCGACLSVVDEEISAFVSEMISSGDEVAHVNGLRLAVSLTVPISGNWGGKGPSVPEHSPITDFWHDRSMNNFAKYDTFIRIASDSHVDVRSVALRWQSISFEQALAMKGGLSPLLRTHEAGMFGLKRTPYIHTQIYWLAFQWPAFSLDTLSTISETLTCVGRHIMQSPSPPWVTAKADSLRVTFTRNVVPERTPPLIDPVAYLGAAAVVLISAESDPLWGMGIQDSRPSDFGMFSELHPYIRHRHVLLPGPPLSDLPVPEEFRQMFRDWAAGTVNFVGSDAGQGPDGGGG